MTYRDYLKRQLDILREIREGVSQWEDLNAFRVSCGKNPVNRDTLRKGSFILREYLDSGWVNEPGEVSSYSQYESVQYNSNGEILSNKIIELSENDLKNPEALLKAHGFDVNEFDIVSYRNSIYKSINGKTSYSSRITVKPKQDKITFEFLDALFDTKEFKNTVPNIESKQYDKDGEFLEIDIPDLHIGLKSTKDETLVDYDLKIARNRFLECIADIVERCKGRKFSKIYFCPLGDIMHFDTIDGKTSKGTQQDVAGRFPEVFNAAIDIITDGINMLREIAPVYIPYVAGNHDRLTGYALIRAISNGFRDADNVKFDIRSSPRKAIHEGKVLIGLEHGDVPKSNRNWLQAEYRKEFGESEFVEIHKGHYHSQDTSEDAGVISRGLPTICPSSPWEYHKGYNSIKTMVSFVWDKTRGLRDMWFSTPM